MEIALEGHCLWSLPSAIRIAKAVEPYRPMWLEELMHPDDPQATAALRRATGTPIVTSERLMTRFAFQNVLAAGAADIVMLDINWTGGLTESKKIAALAATHQLPVCPHNPGGPVCHVVAAHFCTSVPNLFIMESVRAYYLTWFRNIVSQVLVPRDGHFPVPKGPGLGVELTEAFLADPDTLREEVAGVEDQPDYATGNPYRKANQWRQSEQRREAAAHAARA
jgi:L-alanine-DL-glutamate epimerase-like enolase superfamily enzyme